MSSQNDAPDDLIAELAKLMADDARADNSGRSELKPPVAPAPVRIPGAGEAPEQRPAPQPVAPRPVAAEAPKAPPVAPAVRIPGEAVQPEKPAERGTPNFDFDFKSPARAAGPTTPVPPSQPVKPQDVPVEEPDDVLDHDGLADLIAAELANDIGAPAPEAKAPPRNDDNFGVPPVFGLSSSETQKSEPAVAPVVAPQPVIVAVEPMPEAKPQIQPQAAMRSEPQVPVPQAAMPVAAPKPVATGGSDPLSDIERLVGPAVQLGKGEPAAPRTPSPALRSLATPTLPSDKAAEPARKAPASQSVDDAILAAAAASGARVEWVDGHGETGETDFDELPVAPPRRGFRMNRAVAGPLVAVGLLGVAGIGLYWALGQGGAPSGPAPLLVADTAPVKEVPEPAESETPQSVVFNEISGTSNTENEQIVPRDQADEAAVAEANAPATATTPTNNVLSGTDGSAVDPNQEGLVNRKVRTVTVRPDGTIISSPNGVAGATILPVERPNVPAVPGADTTEPDLIASTIAATEESPTPAATTIPGAETAIPAATATPQAPVVQPGSVVPVVDASGAAVQGRTVTVPMQRPSDFAQASASALAAAAQPATGAQQLAAPANTSATAAPAQPAAAAPAAGNAAAYVQFASQRSEAAAQESVQAVQTRYGVLFGGAQPQVQRVDLGDRGIYYRVVLPAASRGDAANICTNVKAAGGDCFLL